MNKHILFVFVFLFCSGLVHGSAYDGNRRGVKDGSPFDWPNFMQPVGNSFISAITFGWGKTGSGDIESGLFYPVKTWEIEICAAGISEDLKRDTSIDSTGVSTDASKIYGPITASLNAQKYNYSRNYTLYEIGWYIQPKNGEINYSIYLIKGEGKIVMASDKYYLPGIKNIITDPAQGDTGYFASYMAEKYNFVVIEYPKGKEFMRAPILDNPYGAKYE